MAETYTKPQTVDGTAGGDTVKNAIMNKIEVNAAGIVSDLNIHAALTTSTHGLGSAAFVSTGAFDLTGVAAGLVTTHAALTTTAHGLASGAFQAADQALLTTSSPTFAGETLSGLTVSLPLFSGASKELVSKSVANTLTALGQGVDTARPAFLVQKSVGQANIAINTEVLITFDTEIFDQANNFAANTFTAPITGKYQFSFSLSLSNVDTLADFIDAYLVTSNRTYYNYYSLLFTADSAHFAINFSILADMDATDTAVVKIVQQNGTAQLGINALSSFSGFLAC